MIEELLSEGEQNKKTTKDLLDALKVGKREFFAMLQRERRSGHFILSTKQNGGGYWKWNGHDIDELKRYDKMQRSEALSMLKTLKPIHDEIRKHEEEQER